MTLRRKKVVQIVALLIAGAYVYVQMTAVTCSIYHIVDESGIAHTHPLGHDHHHAHESTPEEHHHDSGHHDEKEQNCCSEFTSSFFSVFAKGPAQATCTVNKLYGSPVTIAFPFETPSLRVMHYSLYNKEYFYPPPRIPDIRVYIRSFQV